jgi:nicotinamidase-related amidase
MQKTTLTILGALLVAGSVVQMASATEHHRKHRTPVAATEQFRNANNASEVHASAACQNKEPGNPYNRETDYWGWSSWQEDGGWDSSRDCR